MIRGTVSARREAEIVLTVHGESGVTVTITAVVDTGFTGYLTLPTSTVQQLSLPLQGIRDAVLADGQTVSLRIYRAAIQWEDALRPIQVIATEGKVLLGMSMLYGHNLHLSVVDGGPVVIVKTGMAE